VPPTDRELIIRAKLRTGWSSRSTQQQQQHHYQQTYQPPQHSPATMGLSKISLNSIKKYKTNKISASSSSGAAAAAVQKQLPQQQQQLQQQQQQQSTSNSISDAEFMEIEQVLKRAAQIEQKELNRVDKLYKRYNSMNRPQGNGETTCLICNSNFGILGATPRICNDCLKASRRLFIIIIIILQIKKSLLSLFNRIAAQRAP
jgi:flagellar motor protein MotB